MGLMALHILKQGNIPVFFYGQGYMGSLEAILAAPLFGIFGPSYFTLRFGLVLLYALFLLNMYLLTSILYTKRLALFTLLLLCFGSESMLTLQLMATGGHPDMFFFASLLLLYALLLARSAGDMPLRRKQWARILAYSGWGLLAGLALWTDPLLIPYVCASAWLLWRFCHREMRAPVVLGLLLCLVLPLIPVIIYNVSVPITLSTIAFFGAAFWVHGTTLAVAPPLTRIAGTLFVSLPRASGGNVLCSIPHTWPLFTPQNAHAIPCIIVNGLWGVGILVLMLITAALSFVAYRGLRRIRRLQPWTTEQQQEAAGFFAQMLLIGSTLFIVLVYTGSSSAGLSPWTSTRYLICVPIALPAALWPLWRAGAAIKRKLLVYCLKILSVVLLVAVFLSFALGWFHTLQLIPVAQANLRQDADLINTLLNRGITHMYTDYWTCGRIAFESQERIICSVVDEQLQPGVNRYPPYAAIVKADIQASWVFPLGLAQIRTFEQTMQKSGKTYLSFTRDGYVIYMPITSTTSSPDG